MLKKDFNTIEPFGLQAFIQSSLDGLLILNQDKEILFSNKLGKKLLNLNSENTSQFINFISDSDKDLVHFLFNKMSELNPNLDPIEIRTNNYPPKILLMKVSPLADQSGAIFLVTIKDITDSKTSDKMLGYFAKATKDIGSSLKWSETRQRMLNLVIPNLADWCSIKFLDENSNLSERAQDSTKNYHLKSFPNNNSLLSPTQALKTGESIFRVQLNEEELASICETPHQYSVLKENGLLSYMCIPLYLRNRALGVICLLKATPFAHEDQIIAEELANRFAIAADNTQMFEDLNTAKTNVQEAKLTADMANKSKSEFLANMSHEIRTPLAAILGFVELMLSHDEPEMNYKVWGQKIKKNGIHLLHIIDEILDLSKIESGKININVQDVDLCEILSEVASIISPEIAKKSVDFEFAFDSSAPQFFKTDSMKLKQILINIIGNAVKFTESGTIKCHISFSKETSNLNFIISDTGIGLTEDQAQNLFQPFSQGDASHTRRFGGTGLGLSLSKRLARHLGGDIKLLESTPNKGTRFKINIHVKYDKKTEFIQCLPSENPNTDYSPVEFIYSYEDLDEIKILLVEDSIDNQILIQHYLKKSGAMVETANNGQDGLKKALLGNYDVILMDIQMPILNGYQVCEKLRDAGYNGTIIALTAHALKEEVEKSTSVGFDDHLTKPVERSNLLKIIKKLAKKNIHQYKTERLSLR